MELLKQLYCIHSKSNKEDSMLEFLINWLFKNVKESEVEMDKKGNLYIKKGNSETYPCIVAHVDQVQTLHSEDFAAVETNDIIFGWSRKNRRFEGLGADDKNGVWVALKCLLKYDIIKVALFVGEEIGCVGSNAADMDFFDDCRFVLQCDRRGFNDMITDAGVTELCSDEFKKAVNPEWFSYKETSGLMTDVMTLKKRGLKVSCLNLSCGYYEPHSDEEYTIKQDLLNCLYFVEHIIDTCKDVYEHKYEYKPWSYAYPTYPSKGYGYKYGDYGSSYDGYSGVSNKTTSPATTAQKPKEVAKADEVKSNGIESFFDTKEGCKVRDYTDDFIAEESDAGWVDEFLTEEKRDEIYDLIYVLLNDCPNASCDMIRSAVKNAHPELNDKDVDALYHEVKMDMKKYFSMSAY